MSVHSIPCTKTGYHMLERRGVTLTLESGVLRLHERGQSISLGRAEAQPIEWVGQGKMAPMVPLAGLVLDGPGGAWMVATIDTTVVLNDAITTPSPAPHVWVSADDLALMAAACGIGSTRREPLPLPPAPNPKVIYMVMGGIMLVGTLVSVVMTSKGKPSTSCSEQRAPAKELYPRLSCSDARAELDRVERGEASPRAIVLRANQLTVDARDGTGPATLVCDGLEFAVMDAQQADPNGPIVFGEGPHSVLVEELAEGVLRVSQYCICCNMVRGERR